MSQNEVHAIDLMAVPYKVLVSLEQQHERRNNAFKQFAELGLEVEWKIPVKTETIEWDKIPAIYQRAPKYASQALTLLEVFEEAKRRNVESFMHFEDDVIFHPHIQILLPQIMVPNDWKFIYIGGRNNGVKEDVSAGLVRSSFVSDLHAVIFRFDMIDPMMEMLLDNNFDKHWADARIASLHKKYPAYLFRPNLAWQSKHPNDSGTGTPYGHYLENGEVKPGKGN